MNKIYIIILREFLTRVKKKSFILLTVLMPFLMAAVIFVPAILASVNDKEQRKVLVIDKTGKYSSLFEDNESYDFEVVPDVTQKSPEIFAVINIQDNLSEHPEAATISSSSEIPIDLQTYFNKVISKQIEDERILSYDIPHLDEIIAKSKVNYKVKTVKRDNEGNERVSSAHVAMIVGMIFTFFIYMFVLSYGGMVMQSVIEEKTNRIVEIIVSSVKPFQLMMGKMIGIAMVGLLQFLIWGVMLIVILGLASTFMGLPDMGSAEIMEMKNVSTVTNDVLIPLMNINFKELLLMFLLYFIGGYLLYASIYAAIGASVNAQEDSQQFMLPIILLLVFSLYAGIYSSSNPDGPLAFWCSMIPFTSPIVMMIRIPFDVPIWQELLSLAILFFTSIFIVWLAGRIYRVGILMYGKKPTFKEMLKWLRYK